MAVPLFFGFEFQGETYLYIHENSRSYPEAFHCPAERGIPGLNLLGTESSKNRSDLVAHLHSKRLCKAFGNVLEEVAETLHFKLTND